MLLFKLSNGQARNNDPIGLRFPIKYIRKYAKYKFLPILVHIYRTNLVENCGDRLKPKCRNSHFFFKFTLQAFC